MILKEAPLGTSSKTPIQYIIGFSAILKTYYKEQALPRKICRYVPKKIYKHKMPIFVT